MTPFEWTDLLPSTQSIVTIMGAGTITACVFLHVVDATVLMGIAAAYAFLNGGHGAGKALTGLGNKLQGGTSPSNPIVAPVTSPLVQPITGEKQ